MSLYNNICEGALLVGDLLLGKKMHKYFNFLMKSQYWSEDEINNYQNEKLQILIKHAYQHVPYYNELFKKNKLTPDDIKNREDLPKIPLLTKEIIKKNFPNKLVADNIPKKNMILGGSSGSTGQPLQFYKTKESLSILRSANLRGWYWTGFRLGDPYMKIATMPRNKIEKKIQDKLNRSYYVYSRSIDNKDINHILITIKKNKIKIVRGYPGSLYILANYLENNNQSIKLDTIITTSEPLYPYLRNKIERVFQCKVFDSYGAEGAPIIFECPSHSCYHISPEIAITEFMRGEDIVSEGKARMIFTDLTNYATPFIRYDIQDYATISNDECTCGRNLPSITSIEGRDTDILITPSGKFITFYFLAGYFEHQNYIDYFQMVQETNDQFHLYIVPNCNYNSTMLQKIKKDILEVMGSDVNLEVEPVTDIPLTSSGKRRFFIRNPQIKIEL